MLTSTCTLRSGEFCTCHSCGMGAAAAGDPKAGRESIVSTLSLLMTRQQAEQKVLDGETYLTTTVKKSLLPLIIGGAAIGTLAIVLSGIAIYRSRK